MTDEKPHRIASALAALQGVEALETYGRVSAVRGLLIEIAGPVAAMTLGGRVEIGIERGLVPAEVIGFMGDRALAMPFGSLDGVRRGCPAYVRQEVGGVRPTDAWAGRVIDALGRSTAGARCPPGRTSTRSATSRRRPMRGGASAPRSTSACAPSTPS